MCLEIDIDAYKILASVINEELDLYNTEDLAIIIEASMIMFTRSLIMGSIKNLK